MNSLNGSIHHYDPQIKDENALHDALVAGAEHTPSTLIGSELTSADCAALEARWIDRELASRAGLRRADSLTGGEIVGRKGGNYSGILIPYFRPDSDRVREYRLRRDHPDLEYDVAGNLKIEAKIP